ncbi:aminoglycoside phosphotransferase family protein [uncultured Pelagimonas sp.]|uniref:phosphotransferase family protein n=1 Tax=uncultured Pelagimonas sp. TaxID=1618102 RepID=UPI0026151BD8|nr:aminoglycoside phosphotransferase family protein [uncultured Pelagimonas sp.]
MSIEFQQRCGALIEDLGLGRASDICRVIPLTGGVASDIARVDLGNRSICVKFALPKLKVAADWRAPVHRNAAEYAWLKVAAQVQPESSLTLFGHSVVQNGFAMEFLAGSDVYLWKEALLSQAPDKGEAQAVADILGKIHAASGQDGFDRGPFQNRDDFYALRIEPYLVFTAQQHPNLAKDLTALADMLYASNRVLVHGDVSPKNILFRTSGPVLLDAECATMGDASFDVSFCLNHLVIKALHLPVCRDRLLSNVEGFWQSYARYVTWEPVQDLEERICRLLPALMLGRVDGKSPVEYLDAHEQAALRALACDLLHTSPKRLPELVTILKTKLKEIGT